MLAAGKRTSHPTDSHGVPLPDGSWPDEPGSAGGLEVVRRFCNSINREHGADAWRTARELDRWLRHEGHRSGRISRADLDRFVRFRDAAWQAIAEHSFESLRSPAATIRLLARMTSDGGLILAATGRHVDEVLGELISALLLAQHDGTWTRLKTCQHCAWVFYDTSKNRSGRWCSMQTCGGREKARAYRQRLTPRR